MNYPSDWLSEDAPCGKIVWGNNDDIDSGLRKHIDTCDDCQEIRESQENGE